MSPFTIDESAIVPIGHQVGAIAWAVATPQVLLRRNVVVLATFASGVGMLLVPTSNQIAEEMSWRRMERAGVAPTIAFPLLTR